MGDVKVIAIKPVLTVTRKPLKVQDIDDDGVPKKNERGEPFLIEASPVHLIRGAILGIPQAIHKDDDGLRIPQLFNRLDSADGAIRLKEKHYLWLHRLLERRVPLSQAAMDANKARADGVEEMKPPTFAHFLWGDNDAVFVNALRPVEEQKDLYSDEEED